MGGRLQKKIQGVQNSVRNYDFKEEQAMDEQGPTRDPSPTMGKISSVYMISF